MTSDMSGAIIPKSDQTNADDLIAGPMTITIREVRIKGGQEQPVSIYFGDSDKPYKPCKSMCRCLVALWGADASNYVGRSLTLYRDPTVTWAALQVGGIRISHMSHIDREHTMALTASKGNRKPFKVLPLVVPERKPAPEPDNALTDQMMAAAKQGVKAFTAAYNALQPEQKAAIKPIRDRDFLPIARAADAASPADNF